MLVCLVQACSKPPASKGRDREIQDLTVMTALPLFWPEGDVAKGLQPDVDRRAPVIMALAKQFRLKTIDFASDETLTHAKLLLIAQPRPLQPVELVAIDHWVRQGGRLLLFADPLLSWPSLYPLGDLRRPPTRVMLDALFAHWGLSLPPMNDAQVEPQSVRLGGSMVRLETSGMWLLRGHQCSLGENPLEAICLIGKGKVIMIADADLLNLQSESQDASIDAVNGLLDSLSNLPMK